MNGLDRPDPKTQPQQWRKYWNARIVEAQSQRTATIAGTEYSRIAYGDEEFVGDERCRDCDVERGQLHVPACCIERCARCSGQAISCTCNELH